MEIKLLLWLAFLMSGCILYNSYPAQIDQLIEQDEKIRALALQQKLKKNRGEILHIWGAFYNYLHFEAKFSDFLTISQLFGADKYF